MNMYRPQYAVIYSPHRQCMVSVYTVLGVIVAMIYRYIWVSILSNEHVSTTIRCNLLTSLSVQCVIGSVYTVLGVIAAMIYHYIWVSILSNKHVCIDHSTL